MATEPGLRSQNDVFKLLVPKGKLEAVYYDEGPPKERVSGLTLRIREAGSRRWVFYYRFGGAQKRIVIGDATLPLDEARKKARKLRVALDEGQDPAVEKYAAKAAAELTFEKVLAEYLIAAANRLKERSLKDTRGYLEKHWKLLHTLPIASINRSMVAARLRQITKDHGLASGNRARAALSTLFAWAIGEGLCEQNPVSGTNENKEVPRDRVLSDAELAAIWLAAGDTPYGRIVKLLMLTGQRRAEIGGLNWSEIETDQAGSKIVIPSKRTKNGRAQEVPLSPLAKEIIERTPPLLGHDLVFTAKGTTGFTDWANGKAALDKTCKVKGWVLHDLRRTAATRMADLGTQPHIVEAVLNHVSGHKGGIAGVYNRAAYSAEKRAALDLWASHLQVEIAKASGANVTKLKRSRA
jgi:integrase